MWKSDIMQVEVRTFKETNRIQEFPYNFAVSIIERRTAFKVKIRLDKNPHVLFMYYFCFLL